MAGILVWAMSVTRQPATGNASTLQPELIDYTLTDSDGQKDTARLSIYTIDQIISGTVGADNIVGGSLNDAINGETGDDILSGGDGTTPYQAVRASTRSTAMPVMIISVVVLTMTACMAVPMLTILTVRLETTWSMAVPAMISCRVATVMTGFMAVPATTS